MPRYFFHLHNDIHVHDNEGQEMPDDRAALHAAVKYARDMASHSVREGHLGLSHSIRCVAADGREIGVVRFADAVRIDNQVIRRLIWLLAAILALIVLGLMIITPTPSKDGDWWFSRSWSGLLADG